MDQGGSLMRRFNVTGSCQPAKHYMVDIRNKIEQIKALVDDQCYFTINRARQYGKTTTLVCLEKTLKNEYLVISLSFEGIGDESFESSEAFCQTFMELVQDDLEFADVPNSYRESWVDNDIVTFKGLSKHTTKMCQDKKIVLMIDEIDKTSNNSVLMKNSTKTEHATASMKL